MSGTYGITGSADTIVVIRRKRLEVFGTVLVTGRDVADAEISVRFEGMLWGAAPGVLSAASFERMEVYEVIRRRGPAFAKSIADEIGKERSNVQHLIDGLEASGAVARVPGGYAVSQVDISDPTNVPTNSIHSESERGERTHAREAEWVNPCRVYADHGSAHRQLAAGWTCDICYPEGDPA